MKNGFLVTHSSKSSTEHAYGILSLELISFMSLNPTQAVGTEK